MASRRTSPAKPVHSAFGLGVGVGDYDVGSPFGERYFTDDSDDPLARDVRDALKPLPRQVAGRWKLGKGESVGLALAGRDCRSPSAVWHSQGLASLLELGYAPTAPCAALHLDILEQRLRRGNYVSPESADSSNADWTLKCRHVTWILACLAEFQPDSLDHPDAQTQDAQRRITQHRGVLMQAYKALVGDPASDTPAAWIAPRERDGEWWWSEYFDGRHANLLNSLYAVLGICRAERHGFHLETNSYDVWARNAQSPSTLVARFISGINIRSAPGGPRVTIEVRGGSRGLRGVNCRPASSPFSVLC